MSKNNIQYGISSRLFPVISLIEKPPFVPTFIFHTHRSRNRPECNAGTDLSLSLSLFHPHAELSWIRLSAEKVSCSLMPFYSRCPQFAVRLHLQQTAGRSRIRQDESPHVQRVSFPWLMFSSRRISCTSCGVECGIFFSSFWSAEVISNFDLEDVKVHWAFTFSSLQTQIFKGMNWCLMQTQHCQMKSYKAGKRDSKQSCLCPIFTVLSAPSS